MQKNFWARVAAFIRQSHIRKSWRRVVSALTCVVVFCTTYALILPAITMEGTYSCGMKEHVHTEECRIVNSRTELTCSPVHTHSEECYGENGDLVCGLADFVVHSHKEYCYAEDGTLRCVLTQVTEHSGEEGVYYVIEGSEGHNTTAHIHSDSCYIQVRGQQLCTLTEGEAHIHDADCYDADQISCTLEEKEGHVHTGDCYTLIQSCEDETHTHDDTCYYQELTCGQEADGHTHTEACKQPALICTLSTEPHVHTDGCYEMITETTCGKLSLTRHDHTEACVHTETEEILLCGQEEHLHTLICYSDPTADLETAENWEAPLKDLELDGTTAENLLAVARTQLGYTESKTNYTVLEDGITQKGYTRYGAWSGTPYADWNELFIEFCLHYAGIEAEDFPRAEANKTWAETLSAHGLTYTTDGTPIPGDLIFLNIEDTDYTGIVTAVSEEYVTVILGDYKNEVRSETLTLADEDIQLYALLPELEEVQETIPQESIVETTEETIAETTADKYFDDQLRADIDLGMPSTSAAAAGVIARNFEPAAMFALNRATHPDLRNFINTLYAFYKQPGETNWTQIHGDISVSEGTEVRFEISYSIPIGTLNEENHIVVYQLPLDQVSLSSTGNVMDGSEVVGTYVIDDNGLMTITYDPAFAEKNNVDEITGTITFGAMVDDFHKDDDGNIVIDTTGGNSYTITVKDDNVKYHDVGVEKTMTIVDEDKGIIKNVITVTSKDGTNGAAVELKDWMSNNAYFTDTGYPAIQVTGLDHGENYTMTYMSADGGYFTLSLPSMEAGDTYTITYYSKFTTASQGTTKAGNSVTVKGTDDENVYEGSDYAEVTIDFNGDPIEKTHTADSSGNVTWTVTVNADSVNGLKGWSLSDSMSAEVDKVTMTYFENGKPISREITLPYTFNQTYRGEVTFTYTTKVDYVLGESGVSNRATLTPPDGVFEPPYYEDDKYVYPIGEYNPVDKELVSMDKDYKYMEWSLSIGANPTELIAPWTLRDMLNGNQYYTAEQEADIAAKIQVLLSQIYGGRLPNYTLKFQNSYTASDGNTYNQTFLLTVHENLPVIPQGTSYSFTYKSTPDLGDGDQELSFRNLVRFYDKTSDSASGTYDPVLSKKDGSWSTGASVLDNSSGKVESLTWYVEMKITEEMKAQDKDIIIIEDVPDTLPLEYMRLNWYDGCRVDVDALNSGQTQYLSYYNHGAFAITRIVEEDGNVIYRIVVPNSILKYNNDIFIHLQFSLPEDYVPSQYPNENFRFMHDSFTNRVSISYDGGEPFQDTEQTQTVIDPSLTEGQDDETTEKILKYIGNPGTNELPYSIQVNHGGLDLQDDSDWLMVEDILSYQNPGSITSDLIPESVRVTLYDANGSILVKNGVTYDKVVLQPYTGNDITTDVANGSIPFPGTYLASTSAPGDDSVEKKITFYIPDGYFLKLDYTYRFVGSGQLTLNNVAKVTTFEAEHSSADQHEIEIKEAEVTATVQILDIQKVDAENRLKKLAGAVYELYEYMKTGTAANGSDIWEWHYIDILTSDANGALRLGTENGNEINTVIKSETAYYLVEIKAPTGYVLDETRHYFVLRDNTETTQAVVPSDFPDNAYYTNGQNLIITNTYNNKSIAVEKEWRDANGNKLPNVSTEIQAQLNQIFTYDNPDVEYENGKDVNLDLTVGHNSYSAENLSHSMAVKTGDLITITYHDMTVPPTAADTELPGLMEFRADHNFHIPYTTVNNGDGTWDYIFQFKVRQSTVMRGWTYRYDSGFVTVDRRLYTDVHADQTTTVIGTATLNASNDWSARWTGLPSYRLDPTTGQILGYYRYEFEEILAPDGYVTDITTSGNETTIVNRIPKNMALSVKKQWDLPAGTIVPTSIPITLYQVMQEDNSAAETAEVTIQFGNGKTNYHDPTNYYNDTFYNIPVGTVIRVYVNCSVWYGNYTVTGDITKTDGNGYFDITVSGDGMVQFRTTGEERDTPTLTFSFNTPTITGLQTIPYKVTDADTGLYILTQAGPDGTVGTADDWTMNFRDLPAEGMYQVTGPDGTTTQKHVYYSYYVVETLADYTTTYTLNGNTYSICPNITMDGSQVVINNAAYDGEKTEITVNKVWQSANGTTIQPGITNIQFYLMRNGVKMDADLTDSDPTTPYTVTAAENWSLTIKNLPKTDASGKDYVYTLEEIPVPGYEASVNGTTLVNKKFQDTQIKVEKQWKEGMTPEEVGVTLYRFQHTSQPSAPASGSFEAPDLSTATALESQKLNVDNGWTYTWTELPLYGYDTAGNKVYYSYYVKETTDGYVTTYSVDGGITTGTIVIHNEPVAAYELPETGGPGTLLYTLGGLGLCGLAVLGYKPKKRRKEDQTS